MLLSQLRSKKGVWVRLSLQCRLQADVSRALGLGDGVPEHLEEFENSTGVVIDHMHGPDTAGRWPEVIVEWAPWDIMDCPLRYLYDPSDLEVVEL